MKFYNHSLRHHPQQDLHINLDTQGGISLAVAPKSGLEKAFLPSQNRVTHTKGVKSITGATDLAAKFLLDGGEFLFWDGFFVLLF